MSAEIIRHIDTIARDKEIDRDELYESVEQALAQALSRASSRRPLTPRDAPPRLRRPRAAAGAARLQPRRRRLP